MLAALTGAEVVCHTRGGARLSEHLNPGTHLGARDPGRPRRGTLGLCRAPGDEPRAPAPPPGASLPVWSGSAPRSVPPEQCRFSTPPGPIRRAATKLAAKGWDYETMARTLSEAYRQSGPGESRPALPRWESSSMSCSRHLRISTLPTASTPMPWEARIAAETLASVIQKHKEN